jgi:adenosine kinase
VSGFHLTVSPESILEIANHSKDNPDKLFCFNLSAPFISQFFSSQLLSVLPFIDILFGNETEAKAFSAMKKWPEDLTIRDIAIKIVKEEPKANETKERIVVITQGSDSVILVKGKGESIKEYPPIKLTPEQIIDTNGAGDAFVGGFLSQLILKKDLDTCVSAAIYSATEVIQLSGCAFPSECKFNDNKI